MTFQLFNSEQECEREIVHTEINEDDDYIKKNWLNIQELDASINNLELEIKEVSKECNDLQMKNREKLKQMLSSSLPEHGSLAKNTQLFLNLYTSEDTDSGQKICNQPVSHSPTDATNDLEKFSITNEERHLLEILLNNDNGSTISMRECPDSFDYENSENLNLLAIDEKSPAENMTV